MGVQTLSPRARKRAESHKARREEKQLIASLIDEDLANRDANAEELAAFFRPDEDDDSFDDSSWESTEGQDEIDEEERADVLERHIDPRTGESITSAEQLKELRRYLEKASGPFDAEELREYNTLLIVIEAVAADRKELAGIL